MSRALFLFAMRALLGIRLAEQGDLGRFQRFVDRLGNRHLGHKAKHKQPYHGQLRSISIQELQCDLRLVSVTVVKGLVPNLCETPSALPQNAFLQ